MRQKTSILSAILGIMTGAAAKANEKVIFANSLPAGVKSFVQKNFPTRAIAFVNKKGAGYEISLNDGTEVVFSDNGNWGRVDCKEASVPAALLPATIAKNLKELFGNAMVVCIGKTEKIYSVVLSNGICLKYSRKGNMA